jgi:glycine hydroxymethyltransferase
VTGVLILCRGVKIAIDLKAGNKAGPKLKDFKDYLNKEVPAEIQALKHDVEEFAKQFPTIGFEKSEMRYQD